MLSVQYSLKADVLLTPADHWGSGSELHQGQQYFCLDNNSTEDGYGSNTDNSQNINNKSITMFSFKSFSALNLLCV